MSKLLVIGGLVVGLSTAAWRTADATILLKQSLDDLVLKADAIVIGSVSEIQAVYGSDRDIYTLVTLTDLQMLHGTVDDTSLTLRLFGGQIGGDVLEVDGSPTFARGERVLLFVRGNGRDLVPIVGWTQGVFRLERDDASGNVSVKDHERNPLIGVRGSELVRHEVRRPDATFVADPTRPQRPSGSAGVSDDDVVRPATPASAAPGPSDAMDADTFLQVLARRIQEKGAAGKRIESAGAQGRLPGRPDGPPSR